MVTESSKKDLSKKARWVFRGRQRKAILKALDSSKTATQLKEETNIKVTNISDVLRAMVEQNLVICINPDEKLCRFYKRTKLGEEKLKELIKKNYI